MSKDIKDLSNAYSKVYITEAENPSQPPIPPTGSTKKPMSFAAKAAPTPKKTVDDNPEQILKKAVNLAPKGFAAPRAATIGSTEHWKAAVPRPYEGEGLLQYNGMEALKLAIVSTYRQRKNKNGLLIYGNPGEGKTSSIQQFAEEVAEEKGKKYVDWQQIRYSTPDISVEQAKKVPAGDLLGVEARDVTSADKEKELPGGVLHQGETKEERLARATTKIDLISYPEDYFVLVTEYCNGRSPDDYRGIPADVLNDKIPYYSTKQPLWIYFVTLPHAEGIIFFDEINHDTGSIQNELYKVFLERTFGDTRISENFAIYAAGNLGFEESLKSPLRNRMRQGVIIIKPQEWLDWAEQGGINHYVVDFVKSNPGINFRAKEKTPNSAFPTPRTIELFSHAFDNILEEAKNQAQWKKGYGGATVAQLVSDRAAEYCGPEWAGKFVAYMRDIAGVDFSKVKHEELANATTQELWPILSYVQQEINAVHAQWSEDTNEGINPRSFLNFPDDPNKVQEVNVINGIAKIANHLLPNWCRQLFNRLKHQTMYTNPKTGKREPDENFFTKLIVFLINGNYDSATKNEFNKPGGTYAQLQEYLADMPKNIPAADLQGGNGVVAPAANAGVKKK
jgi:hypothetical protein